MSMLNPKYIILKGKRRPESRVFPATIEHVDFAQGREIISAGFCSIYSTEEGIAVRCYGRSESLDVDSKPLIDAEIIWREYLC